MENLKTMNIEKALTKEQNKLSEIAKTKGLYENFGQKEVRKLEDKYIDMSDYSEEMKFFPCIIFKFIIHDNLIFMYDLRLPAG